jgi:prefoldin subunit 5
MKNLVDIYNEMGPDLPLFLHLYRQVKKEELNKQGIVDLIQNQHKFIDMGNAINLLNNHINYLRKEKEELKESIKNYLEDRERIAS